MSINASLCRCRDSCQRRETRAASIVFFYRGPTVLANVLTKSLLTDRFEDLFGEMAVRAVKEIDAFRHDEDLSGE